MTRLNGWKQILLSLTICAAMPVMSPAQSLTTLLSFDISNGNYPTTPLIQGTDGQLYGVTEYGSANVNDCANFGCGTLFSLTPQGVLATLYNFCAQANCADGAYPYGGLTLLQNGTFYGTTYGGGLAIGGCNNAGCGTAFQFSPPGTLSTLYDFCSQTGCADGVGSGGSLVQAPGGNFFGTTYGGGSTGNGVVFKMTPTGTLTTIYNFCSKPNCSDGSFPFASLIQASDGNFYGMTSAGGTMGSYPGPCYANGCGTVFKITPSGNLTTLYRFCSLTNCSDGALPYGGLVQASDGSLWGTTGAGGKHGCGTVFAITGVGKLTTVHSFNLADGYSPSGSLIQANDGNFYGITAYGGSHYVRDKVSGGTLFRITPHGILTTLYNFCAQQNCADGEVPFANLTQLTNGVLYGTTSFGGRSSNCYAGCGTIFSLSLNLGPFVSLIHSTGPVGQTGGILGQGFTGTTAVAINGIPASFTVVSDTWITATVPPGATTGYVTVTTPSGVLKSNVPFRVIP